MFVTEESFGRVLRWLDKFDDWTVDVETTGLHPYHGDCICGIAIMAGDRTFYFSYRHAGDDNLPLHTLPYMILALNDPARKHTGFNYKFDTQMLALEGMDIPYTAEDPMLAAHLLNENEYDPTDKTKRYKPTFKLKRLADKYLGPGSSAQEKRLDAMLQMRNWGKGDLWRLPGRVVSPYAQADVRLTRGLREFFRGRLAKQELLDIYRGVCRYQMVVTRMERTGLLLDPDRIATYSSEADFRTQDTINRMREITGIPNLNPGSSPQMQKALGMSSTRAELLEMMPESDERYPLIRLLEEYRAWKGVTSRYYEPMERLSDKNNVLHPNLFLTGTISGRLSAGGGLNTQALPRHAEGESAMGQVKNVIVARPGSLLFNADYSQAELRFLAHYTRDKEMQRLFAIGADMHTETAKQFGIPRDVGKRLNFGIAYGLGEKGLADRAHISRQQARLYLKKYHAGRPGIRALQRQMEIYAETHGYIPLWTGRRRHYNVPWSETHKAMSNLIQGAVAEMMRVTINRLGDALAGTGIEMLLQVHDSILFDVPEDQAETAKKLIPETMLDFSFFVDPAIELEIGKSYGEMVKVV